jgi:hypothetical protein
MLLAFPGAAQVASDEARPPTATAPTSLEVGATPAPGAAVTTEHRDAIKKASHRGAKKRSAAAKPPPKSSLDIDLSGTGAARSAPDEDTTIPPPPGEPGIGDSRSNRFASTNLNLGLPSGVGGGRDPGYAASQSSDTPTSSASIHDWERNRGTTVTVPLFRLLQTLNPAPPDQ